MVQKVVLPKWKQYSGLERSKMTREKRFALGIKDDAELFESIKPEERGDLTVSSIDVIRNSLKLPLCSIVDIMNEYHISRETVYRLLEVTLPESLTVIVEIAPPQKWRRLKPFEVQQIINEYTLGNISKMQLAEKHKTSLGVIIRALKRNGIPILDDRQERKKAKAPSLTESDEISITKLYDSGITKPRDIARKLNSTVTENQVRYYLNKTRHHK